MKRVLLWSVLFFAFSFLQAQTATYNYVGSIETYTVPAGVSVVKITAAGAEGGFGTSSVYDAGRGAVMEGYFAVTPGQQLQILVGERPTSGNGGGGGTFVCDVSNNPLIAAGGGGGASEDVDDTINKHGQITTTGGTGAAGGGLGGDNGNGGAIGASFASGAGGGLLTDGADGWTTNTGGTAFVNGGTVANGSSAYGGFGGGGVGSGYVVGGGGGGYSGGGGASNSVGGGGVGGGGGSYNSGAFQNNIAGANTGHGYVIIEAVRGTSYAFTGTIDDFVVPTCIYGIRVEIAGARGGNDPSSTHSSGLGAILSGDFNVLPGDTFKCLVGEFPSADGNGGGGGSFFVKSDNTPYIIAGGGGGSSESVDDPVNKHGQITTAGGNGAAGGGIGGDNGNGGAAGATFTTGAGGGFLTDGADGWTTGTGGLSFLNGGTPGYYSAAPGGFGGGGAGSSYVVGGGGGGYSGGGSGSNSVGGGGVGGGGGSYNAGANPMAIAGANAGNGYIIIVYDSINPFYNSAVLVEDSVCAGDTVLVSVTNALAADTIAWTSDAGEYVSTVDDTSAYFVFYTGATTLNAHVYTGSCFDSLLTFAVYVDSVTVSYTVTHSSTGSDGEIIASATGFGTVEYNIDGGTWQVSGTFSGLAPGMYCIGRMDEHGCAYYDSVEVMDASFISENFASQVIMYPNPTNSELNVEIGMDLDEVLLQITDMSGRIVRSEMFTNVRTIQLDVSGLNSGVYMLSSSG